MDRKIATLRALNKVMWIQNDLFSRHYTVRSHDVKSVLRDHDNNPKGTKSGLGSDGGSGPSSFEHMRSHDSDPPSSPLLDKPLPKVKSRSFLGSRGR